MTRMLLLLSLAGLSGSASAVAPTAPATVAPKPTSIAAPAAATAPQEVNVSWVARYGFYDAKHANWDLLPRPGDRQGFRPGNGKGC